jgi:hypothetical protein
MGENSILALSAAIDEKSKSIKSHFFCLTWLKPQKQQQPNPKRKREEKKKVRKASDATE